MNSTAQNTRSYIYKIQRVKSKFKLLWADQLIGAVMISFENIRNKTDVYGAYDWGGKF